MTLENQALHLQIAELEAQLAEAKARTNILEQALREIENRIRTKSGPIREALNNLNNPAASECWKWVVYGSCIHAQIALGPATAEELDLSQAITIRYTNWQGVTSTRRIVPLAIRYAATEWHPQPQWVIDAYCCERGALRAFAVAGIHKWGVEGEEVEQ